MPFVGSLVLGLFLILGPLIPGEIFSAEHSYVVQLNAYKDSNNAEKFLIRMKRKGYDPFLITSRSGRWHKVQLGPFMNFEEAQQTADKLKRKERLFPVVMVALENFPDAPSQPPAPSHNPTPSPAPVSTASLSAPDFKNVPMDSVDRVMARFLSWKDSWEKGNVESYLSYYSEAFDHGKNSLSAWQRSREKALKKNSSMKIDVGEIKVTQNENQIEMSFIQEYYSKKVSDTGHKMLVWEWDGEAWRIVREIWVPVLMQ